MKVSVICSDGVQRHEQPFSTRRAALQWQTFGHVCYLGHRVVQDTTRPDLADGATAGVTDQPSDRPPLAPASSFASILDVQERIREAREDVTV